MTSAVKQQWKTEKNKVISKRIQLHYHNSIMSTELNSQNYLDMDLLRFTTAGSVDDGKSTLIGRLLYDSKSIFEDQYEAVKATSEKRGEEYVNLALLTDGLRAEREQGITIDVAYRYFATPKRKFIIADTPGHIQYTRNMVTGASTANLAIILIDARKGVIEQTMRHTFIASLLRIPHVVVCVNKMDLVDFQQDVYEKIKKDYEAFASKLETIDIHFLPISALNGDNVVDRSPNMPWYEGSTLLHLLENVHISSDQNHIDCRFPVQYVIRPMKNEFHDYRGFAGRVAGGVFRKGDKITVLPSGFNSTIKSIDTFTGEVEEAFAPMSVTITLEDEIDISRGDMIARENNQPQVSQDIDVMICWFNNKPLQPNSKFVIRHTTREARAIVKEINYKVDINTLHRNEDDKTINMNDIARVRLRTTVPLLFDSYSRNRNTGSIILVDEATNETVAAGMII
jgi:sulfate adenylyltransferase subunit 1